MTTLTPKTAPKENEDPLMYLPRKGVVEYKKGQIIYDENQRAAGLYLVVQGRVRVSMPVDSGAEVMMDVYSTDEFFGESGLLDLPRRGQRATAMDNSSLMYWSTQEIEDYIERQPKLGLALIQVLVQRTIDLEQRLETFALDKTPERVARSLLRFAERLGTRTDDGSLRMPPMTHQQLSEYVGTSREIVTFQLNRLRREGFVQYTRKGINLYAEALREALGAKSAVLFDDRARHA